MRSLAFCAGALCAFLTFGCEELDPVRTQDLCDGPGPISMRCPQCLKPKYDDRCSICRHADVDPELCGIDSGMSSPENGGRGGHGGSEAPSGGGGAGDSSEAGEGGAGAGGADGGEGQAGESGSGGMTSAGAGQGGAPPPMASDVCTGDLWCATHDALNPHCDTAHSRCVECTEKEHCPGGVCDQTLQRCRGCMVDGDCKSNACDEVSGICVDCNKDADCQVGDPTRENGSCNPRTFRCVDCVDNSGCRDLERSTCDKDAFRCVDCLNELDCDDETKPACYMPMRVCVPCLENRHCHDPVLNTCDKENRKCVDCIDDSGCVGGANAHCDSGAQKCVQCTDPSHCGSGHCVKQRCVECEADDDCGNPKKARCDLTTNTCTTCSGDRNCTHLDETTVCDADSGSCVECNNDSTCGDKACIRAQHTCSDVTRGSLDVCIKCAADSMCRSGMRCVSLNFAGEPTDSYCVFLKSMRPSSSCNNARPYTQQFSHASIDNVSTTFCIPPATTSCPGVLSVVNGASGDLCSTAAQCGLGRGDAICNDMRCTYACNGQSLNCAEGLSCLPNGVCG